MPRPSRNGAVALGSARAPRAADDALVVGLGVGTPELFSVFVREEFGARARQTAAGAAALPISEWIVPVKKLDNASPIFPRAGNQRR